MWPELQAQYGHQIQLIQVDRDSPAGLKFSESYRINYQPGFVVLNANGDVTYAALGPYTPGDVRKLVESSLPR